MTTNTNVRRKLFWYDVKTWLGVMLFIGLLAPFAATGIADVFGGLFLFAWYYKRTARRPLYEASLGSGHLYNLAKEADRTMEAFDRSCIVAHFAGADMCPICQAVILSPTGLCNGLREVFPHRPADPVPHPNPWEWSWFKYNGYAPPPPEWPKTKIYISPLEPDIEAMKAEGRRYYEKHGNALWDAGYGRIPDWYVKRSIDPPIPSWVSMELLRQSLTPSRRKAKTREEREMWWPLERIAKDENLDIEKLTIFAKSRRPSFLIIDSSIIGFKVDALIDDFRLFEAAERDERERVMRNS